jgi:hypothetical protein
MQYTASSFAAPLLAPFALLSGTRAHRAPGRFATHVVDPVLDEMLRPMWVEVRSAARRLGPIQHSRLSARLLSLGLVLVALLLYLLMSDGPR